MGWNGVRLERDSPLFADYAGEKLYFVHSYHADPGPRMRTGSSPAPTTGEPFVSAVQKGRVAAVQFHPEKSGAAGLGLLRRFLSGDEGAARRR